MVEQKIPFIALDRQYKAYREELDNAMADVISSLQFIQGSAVMELEEKLSEFIGVRHCISCGSGTDALLIALLAIGLKPGDEVITTPFTFFATAEVISFLGAKPVFIDIEPDTFNIRADLIPSHITGRTKAIMPVGIYGQPSDMDDIISIAERYELPVVEDAAQSFGAKYRGKRSGALGTIGCTSFYPSKPLGCFGDGGAIFTEDDKLASECRMYMNHGQSSNYRHERIGINGRLDAIQAAVLRVKLKYYEEEIGYRQKAAQKYKDGLADLRGVGLPVVRVDRTSVFAQYTIRVKQRDFFRKYLNEAGIPTAVHYPVPVYRQPVYRKLLSVYEEKENILFGITEAAVREVVSLPFGSFILDDEQKYIIEIIRKYFI